jgi:hypothetical protein
LIKTCALTISMFGMIADDMDGGAANALSAVGRGAEDRGSVREALGAGFPKTGTSRRKFANGGTCVWQ